MEKTGSRNRLLNSKRFLATQRVARLATVSANGKPHIVSVVYTYDRKHVYIVLDEKPRRVALLQLKRARNIAANPYVSLLVDRYGEDWRKLVWVRADFAARQSAHRSDRALAREISTVSQDEVRGAAGNRDYSKACHRVGK